MINSIHKANHLLKCSVHMWYHFIFTCEQKTKEKHHPPSQGLSRRSVMWQAWVTSYVGSCGCCRPLQVSMVNHYKDQHSARSSRLLCCVGSRTEDSPVNRQREKGFWRDDQLKVSWFLQAVINTGVTTRDECVLATVSFTACTCHVQFSLLFFGYISVLYLDLFVQIMTW